VDTIDGDSAIYVGSSDGSDARKILAIRATEPKLSWPRDDVLFFESRRPDGNISDLTALTLDGKISVLLSHKTNLEYVWSRDGKKLLFSYFSNHGIELWYMDTGTGVPLPLSLSTSAQKCAWRPDSTSIVCGVPPSESLTRDTASGRTSTLDDIVTLSLLTGDTQKMYSAQKGSFLGVTEPLVSSSGNFLVFINSFDQRPYRFALP
jgi:Tol biopolymer transport system component